MKEEEGSARRFKITPAQYYSFRFRVPRPMKLNVQLIATAPVNVLLGRTLDKAEYEKGTIMPFSDSRSWEAVDDLDRVVDVDPGTWYLTVEGVNEPSTGLIKAYLA